jgi:hypothetical protein
MRTTRNPVAVVITTAMLLSGMVATGHAKDSLSGVTQNWDKTLPANDPGGACPASSSRFECVMNGAAVRDNETGLVWEQSPSATQFLWADARDACAILALGGRYGWRLPSVVELTSCLPPGRRIQRCPLVIPSLALLLFNGRRPQWLTIRQ